MHNYFWSWLPAIHISFALWFWTTTSWSQYSDNGLWGNNALTGAFLSGDNTNSLESLSEEEVGGNKDSLMWAASAPAWAQTSHHNEQPQPLIRPWISKSPKPILSIPVGTETLSSKFSVKCFFLNGDTNPRKFRSIVFPCAGFEGIVSFQHFDILKGN